LAIVDAKANGWAQLADCGTHAIGAQRKRLARNLAHPVSSVIVKGTETAIFLSSDIERIELQTSNRPSTVGNPRSPLEIDRLEGMAAPLPMVGRAAEEA